MNMNHVTPRLAIELEWHAEFMRTSDSGHSVGCTEEGILTSVQGHRQVTVFFSVAYTRTDGSTVSVKDRVYAYIALGWSNLPV